MASGQPVMGGGMTGRKCSTCKHYEPAPIWRRGWCRNPVLYAPQQNHLVFEDDLDCERGMGNYWEPADATGQIRPFIPLQPIFAEQKDPSRIISTRGGQPIYSVSGSSGYSNDPDDDYLPVDDDMDEPPPSGGRDLGYYPEERYWTDYLRIGAPILGVILILALFWFWAQAFWGDDNDANTTANGTAVPTLPAITASPTTTVATGTGQPPIIVTTPPAGASTQPPGTENPPETGGELAIGGTAVVANSGGTGVNFRAEPSTDSDVIDVLLDGTSLTILDGPVSAEGYTWWQVESDSGTGWLVQDYMQAQ